MLQASITGLFKTLLLIIGGFVLLRFLGQLMVAKRNLENERRELRAQRKFEKQKRAVEKEKGKIKILNKKSPNDTIDTNYEEL